MKVWDYEVSVERKCSIGGTSKAAVQKQIDDCLEFANSLVQFDLSECEQIGELCIGL